MTDAKLDKTPLFVDTSAFKAVFDEADDFHEVAWNFWRTVLVSQIELMTTNFILDETYTLFRSHLGQAKTLILRDKFAQSHKSIKIVRIRSDDETMAWEYFEKLNGRGVSFTDCTSFALMHRMQLKNAFTFDSDFKHAGFTCFP